MNKLGRMIPPGPIAEFGVFEGRRIKEFVKLGRTVYAFDTFEGFSSKMCYDPKIDYDNPPGSFTPRFPVMEKLKKYPNVVCVQGLFQDTLPKFDPSIKFAFVHLDCDWYSSYRYVVRELANRMLPKAFAVVDDYRACEGCRKAIDEMESEGIIWYDRKTSILKWNKRIF